MMVPRRGILLILYCALYSVGVQSENQLVFVQAIWRHGDRAPKMLPYPNDGNTEAAWPREWAQLTNLGIRQLYDLGSFFRHRYGSFVGEYFNVTEVYLLASAIDRAVVSAQAMLRGFFPAVGADIWMEGETWQPLPFHSLTSGQPDPLLRPGHYKCPAYDDLWISQKTSLADTVKDEYADVFKFLVNVTGFPSVGYEQIYQLYGILPEVIHGLPQPEWVNHRWPSHGNSSTLEIIADIQHMIQLSEFNTSAKAILRGGYLLGSWLDRALNVSKGIQANPTKMMLFSAHDNTLTPFIFTLNVSNGLVIPYAACLIMEIYKTQTDEFAAKLLYRNETFSDTVHELIVPGCEALCPLSRMIEIMYSKIFNNQCQLQHACGIKAEYSLGCADDR